MVLPWDEQAPAAGAERAVLPALSRALSAARKLWADGRGKGRWIFFSLSLLFSFLAAATWSLKEEFCKLVSGKRRVLNLLSVQNAVLALSGVLYRCLQQPCKLLEYCQMVLAPKFFSFA